MKRVLSVVLILATVLSCVCFCAYAESEAINGVYNNYAYYCYGIISTTSASLYMSYNDSSKTIRIKGTYSYKDTDGDLQSERLICSGKVSTFLEPLPTDFGSFSSMHPTFYIGTYAAATMSLSA